MVPAREPPQGPAAGADAGVTSEWCRLGICRVAPSQAPTREQGYTVMTFWPTQEQGHLVTTFLPPSDPMPPLSRLHWGAGSTPPVSEGTDAAARATRRLR